MREKLSSMGATSRMRARLNELLGPNYVIRSDMNGLDRLHIYPKVSGFWKRITNRKAAEIIGYEEEYKYIELHDGEIYPQMKQFGEEFEFNCLKKCWPGADLERRVKKDAPKKEQVKKLEKTREYLVPRYEQIEEVRK